MATVPGGEGGRTTYRKGTSWHNLARLPNHDVSVTRVLPEPAADNGEADCLTQGYIE